MIPANTNKSPDPETQKRAEMRAEASLSPIIAAAATARQFSSAAAQDAGLKTFVAVICEAVDKATANGLRLTEVTLSAQAIALDVIFNECAQRAANMAGDDLVSAETLLRLALKAQSQCRTTLLTLAEIKNPRPIAFVNQANFARGAQQVNNRPAEPDAPDAPEKISDEVVEQTGEADDSRANPENSGASEVVKPRRNGWTEERRARQAELTRAQKPWLNASGPKTELGKAIAASNARKHFTPGRLGNHLPENG